TSHPSRSRSLGQEGVERLLGLGMAGIAAEQTLILQQPLKPALFFPAALTALGRRRAEIKLPSQPRASARSRGSACGPRGGARWPAISAILEQRSGEHQRYSTDTG